MPKKSKPFLPLYPYQRRWVEDDSRFKIACKARQIGFSFAATFRVVQKRRRIPGLTVWLSASERQALEAMEYVRRHLRVLGLVARYEETYGEGTSIRQQSVRLANGSRIVALPANPDTVRGFAGDIVLDEFAFHRDADAIWRAAFATATRGYQLEIISTPNGARGKYYELARAAGLVDYDPLALSSRAEPRAFSESARRSRGTCFPPTAPVQPGGFPHRDSLEEAPAGRSPWAELSSASSASSASSIWSPHWVDLSLARAQGFAVDVESLRAAIDDEDAWQQEYCCRFLSDAAHYIPPELVVAAEHPAATINPPLSVPGAQSPVPGEDFRRGRALALPKTMPGAAQTRKGLGETLTGFPQLSGPLYLGVDIGRRRDLTVLWLLEVENAAAPPEARVSWTRGIVTLDRQPFSAQRQTLDAFLARRSPAILRCAIDATGLGAMLAEELQQKWGARVEPVHFTLPVKEDLAVRVKRLLEDGRLRLPADPVVRAALASVKRYATATGHFRFDADRTDRAGHADHFWALALALAAAEEPALSVDFVSSALPRSSSQARAF